MLVLANQSISLEEGEDAEGGEEERGRGEAEAERDDGDGVTDLAASLLLGKYLVLPGKKERKLFTKNLQSQQETYKRRP